MSRIKSYDLEDVIFYLPEAKSLASLPSCIDLFICALGFEERCLHIAGKIKTGGTAVDAACYLSLNTNSQDNNRSLEDLLSLLPTQRDCVSNLNADDEEYEEKLGQIIQSSCDRGKALPTVVFDISVTASRLLLRTAKVLIDSNIDLHIVYTEADEYGPTEREYFDDLDRWTGAEQLGTEKGVSSILPSKKYAGQHLDPLPNFAILFANFRAERSLAVLSKIDETLVTNPRDNVFWIVGDPPSDRNKWRSDAVEAVNAIEETTHHQRLSTFDYKQTLALLERIHRERWDRYNITISPLGSKLQGIGVLLFCFLHPDVRLMFAAPAEYNAACWSHGIGAEWTIHFGDTCSLREKLSKVGSLSIED